MRTASGPGRVLRRLPAARLALVAAVWLLPGCHFPTTVYGRLELKPGEEGDVRLARIELRDSAAWDSAPAYVIDPDSGGLFHRAAFEFPAVVPGPYYLRAWQDLDADERVSDGDLTGVYGGQYQPGLPGRPVMVYQGWTVDVGVIELSRCRMLEVAAEGWRSQNRETTAFTYAFNHDVRLASLTVTFPGQPPIPDPDAPGLKLTDTTYRSGGWRMEGPMPTGLHQLEFRGAYRDSGFSIRVALSVE